MNENISQLVQRLLSNSLYRGIDPTNPPVFVIQPSEENAETWNIIVSQTEPTFSRTPYNALWIPADLNDVNYGKLLLRVSHEQPSFSYRSEWVEVTTSEEAFAVSQFYQPVVEDLALYGITDPNADVPNAAVGVLGAVRLAANSDSATVQAYAIDPDDPRMTDDRYPTDHDHPDYARTMVKINDSQFAYVNRSSPPSAGMLLFLEHEDPINPDVFYAKWRYPTEADLDLDFTLSNLVIEGPSEVGEQTSTLYKVKATFGTDREIYVTPTAFTANVVSTIAELDANTGILLTKNINADEMVTLTATFSYRGVDLTATLAVNIVALPTLLNLTIVGPDAVPAGTNTLYEFLAVFSDSSSMLVTPDSFTTSNTSISSILGEVLVANTIFVDAFTTLNASYTFDGVTVDATAKPVLVEAAAILPQTLRIQGPTTLQEGETTIPYTFIVTYNNGIEDEVIPETFESDLPLLAVVNPDYSVTSPLQSIDVNTQTILTATYTESGITLTDTHDLLLLNSILPDFLRITGGAYTNQTDPVSVQLTSLTDRVITIDTAADLVMDDGSTVPGTTSNVVWEITGPDALNVELSVYPTGSPTSRYIQIKALSDVMGTLNFTLTATMTYEGQPYTVSRPTEVLQYVEPPVTPINMRVRIVGGPDANTSQHDEDQVLGVYYEAQLTDNPGVWVDVTAEATLTAVLAEPTNGAVLSTDFTQLTLPEVVGNKNVVISAAYTLNAVVVTSSYTVVIVDTTPYPMELRIRKASDPTSPSNASSENEGTVVNFVYLTRYTTDPSTWVDITTSPDLTALLSNGPAGTVLSPDYTELTLPEVTGNQLATISGEYTFNGVTVNGTYDVTIVDNTVNLVAFRARRAAAPNASTNTANVDENTNIEMVYQAQYSDSPNWIDVTADASITEEILSPSFGVTVTNRIVAVPEVDQNRQVTLNATYTFNGSTLPATYVFNIVDFVITPLELRLRTAAAPTAANNFASFPENSVIPMVVMARFSDAPGVWVDVEMHPGLTVGFSNPLGATIVDMDVTLPEITADVSITLQASLTQSGTTVNTTYRFDVIAEPDTEIISPRWGKAPQQQWLADYSTPAFYNLLTNPLTGVDNEVISFTGTETGYQEMWFMLIPKEWEYPYVVEVSTGFAGGWDGGGHTVNDGAFIPNAEAIINGNEYWVYRVTFPLGVGNFAYRVRYNTADPRSGFE